MPSSLSFCYPSASSPSSFFYGRLLLALLVFGVLELAWEVAQAVMRQQRGPAQQPNQKTEPSPKELDLYQCPSHTMALDMFNAEEPQVYLPNDRKILQHFEDYARNFRHQEYDAWGLTYSEVKEKLAAWKMNHSMAHVKSGDSMYESAMGIGLNLIMTTELLYETRGVTNLTVFGNDYVEESVEIANSLYESGIAFPNSTTQRRRWIPFCPGDSRNLSYIPSNTFDVVFSGHITPLQDPLQMGDKWKATIVKKLCDSKDAHDQAQIELMQRQQNDWFHAWIVEMIRIAKPGTILSVDEVSRPLCEERGDWGGVPPSYWQKGKEVYGWDIDPKSIVFGKDNIFSSNRYHVLMQKSLS